VIFVQPLWKNCYRISRETFPALLEKWVAILSGLWFSDKNLRPVRAIFYPLRINVSFFVGWFYQPRWKREPVNFGRRSHDARGGQWRQAMRTRLCGGISAALTFLLLFWSSKKVKRENFFWKYLLNFAGILSTFSENWNPKSDRLIFLRIVFSHFLGIFISNIGKNSQKIRLISYHFLKKIPMADKKNQPPTSVLPKLRHYLAG